MELEELFKQYLEAQLAANKQSTEPAAEPVYATKADVEAAVQAALAGLGEQVAVEVQKALPVIEREPGAGRRGLSNEGAGEPDQLEVIVKKAQETPDKLDQDEKELIYRLSYEVMVGDLRY